MEKPNIEQTSTTIEKKTWAMPELIVIDKKVIESGVVKACHESNSTYCGGS